jgi:hypothetical protein
MNKKIKSAGIILLVIAAVAGFFWIVKFFGSGEGVESEKPAVVCKPQNASPEQQECFWTAHVHATVRVFRGGKEIPVRFEEGKLEGQHTHSEPNKIHWHGLIPVDSKTKEVTDWSVLEVQRIVADLGLSQEGTPKFIVSNQEVDPSYIWKEGDTIEIRYE